jgi:methionyl-tRNA synthetase
VGEYKLPDYIPTRGHLMLQGQKFSKSRKWYISLRDFLKAFPADYLRYYLCAITPYSQVDTNFDWDDFEGRINNELVANIGNFIHRALTFIDSRFGGEVPAPTDYDADDREFEAHLLGVAGKVEKDMSEIEIERALKALIEFTALCNQYFQRKRPWADAEAARTCLYLSANGVRILAILLEPFIPASAEALWAQLNQQGSVHDARWHEASQLLLRPGHRIQKPKILFRKIDDSEIKGQKDKLKALPPP